MTGVSAIQYYSVQIYALAGINGSSALKYQATNSIICSLIGQFFTILFIDKFGRRWVLILGICSTCAVSSSPALCLLSSLSTVFTALPPHPGFSL